jgi:hypothetical protein
MIHDTRTRVRARGTKRVDESRIMSAIQRLRSVNKSGFPHLDKLVKELCNSFKAARVCSLHVMHS